MNRIDARIEFAVYAVLYMHRNEKWDDSLREDLAKDIRVKLQSEGLASRMTETREHVDARQKS